jgi:type II secretory pathway pseudopilin PulG
MARRTMFRGRHDLPATGEGFTLAEVLIAVVLVGLGVAALMVAAQSSTQVNAAGWDLTQATYIAQEIREWTLKLPFSDPDPADAGNPPGPDGTNPQIFVDDLDDLMDVTYGPPRNGVGQAISDLGNWSELIHLDWKDPDDLCTTVVPGSSDVIRVAVTVSHNGGEVLTTGWLVVRRSSE